MDWRGIFVLAILYQYSHCELLGVPKVYRIPHWSQQFLNNHELMENMGKRRDTCIFVSEALQDKKNFDVYHGHSENNNLYVSVAIPQGATVALPCIYCGPYAKQEKSWYRADFTWDLNWDETGVPVELYRRHIDTWKESVTGKPDNLYKIMQRKDEALVISNFSVEDSGMFSCYHKFLYDYETGRMTYILDLLSTDDTIVKRGDTLDFLEYKERTERFNINIYRKAYRYTKADKFFHNTELQVQLVAQGKCEGLCKGKPGYQTQYFTTYLVRNDSVHPGTYHPEFRRFSSGIHVRSSLLRELDPALSEKLHDLRDFFISTPCHTDEICPDPEGKPLQHEEIFLQEKMPYPTKEAQSIVLKNVKENIEKFHIEVMTVRVTNPKFVLHCYLESDEVAIWFHTSLENVTKQISKQLKFGRSKEQVEFADTGQNYKPYQFKPSSDPMGYYSCYGENIDVKKVVKKKEYFIITKGLKEPFGELFTTFAKKYTIHLTLMFIVLGLYIVIDWIAYIQNQ